MRRPMQDAMTGTYDMHPIPGTEDLYYTIAEKKPFRIIIRLESH